VEARINQITYLPMKLLSPSTAFENLSKAFIVSPQWMKLLLAQIARQMVGKV
jgi:hypothetical protein